MGYRTYLAIVDKKKLNRLRKSNSIEEVAQTFEKFNWKYDVDTDNNGLKHYYCPIYNLDHVAEHEFGKYYDNNYEEFDESKKRIFKNPEVDAYYQENDFDYGGIELLEFAIKDYRLRIQKWFSDLLDPKKAFEEFENKYKILNKSEEEIKEMHYQKLLHEVKDKLQEWSCEFGYLPYDDNKDNDRHVRSWIYEYAIFDLIRLYKLFDPKKHYVVYYGY